MEKVIRRADIYWAELPVIEGSQIQAGYRPVVITANKFATEHSPAFQYVPITTQIKRTDLPIHVVLSSGNLYKPSMALVEQVGLIDRHRLREYVGHLSVADMFKIDMAIIKQLDINVGELSNLLRSMQLQHAV
jgi:mRNA interferase MazF